LLSRSLYYNEILNYKWKYYPMNVTKEMDKFDFIKFEESLIYKKEKNEDGWSVIVSTIGLDIIIVDKKGSINAGTYNHIFKGDRVSLFYNNKSYTFHQIKNKIDKIIFLDDLWLHDDVRNFWSEKGFRYNKEVAKKIEMIKCNLMTKFKNNILQPA